MMKKRNTCDNCLKDMGEKTQRYCQDCRKKIRQRSSPRDCHFCEGKQTVHATYHMEGDWGTPYICHHCMKDQRDGFLWEHIPPSLANMHGSEETDTSLRQL
jgi:hypothetical protein